MNPDVLVGIKVSSRPIRCRGHRQYQDCPTHFGSRLQAKVVAGSRLLENMATAEQADISRMNPYRNSWMISFAAFAPLAPVRPFPGCVPFPHRNSPFTGV
jgi:hypothetical protein